MDLTALEARPVRPTIASTRRPVEEYWDGYAPGAPSAAGLDAALPPLDGFLVHLLLGLHPPGLTLVDLASAGTRGASTVVGLTHPSSARILAWPGGEAGVADALQAFARDREAGGPTLDILPTADLPSDLSDRRGLVILADARGGDADALAAAVAGWLDTHPTAVVLVLGVGPVGESAATAALLRGGPGVRVWLVREAAEALAGSRLAIAARPDHPLAAHLLARLGGLFTGNVRYLDLLWDLNLAAVRAADVDADALRAHPTAGPLLSELNEWKRKATDGEREAARLRVEAEQSRAEAEQSRAEAERSRIEGERSRVEAAADRAAANRAEQLREAAREEAERRLAEGGAAREEAGQAAHERNLARIALAKRDHELALVRASLAYRAAVRLSRVRSWLAPAGSLRHRAARRLFGR